MTTHARIALAVLTALLALPSAAGAVDYEDPSGDDNGPGTYVYPTDRSYSRSSFDIRKVTIEASGSDVELRVEIGARIEDPWRSSEWDGNGFSLQFAQVYIDLTPGDTEGHTETLPGINAQFAADQAWNRVVLISPQGQSRLRAEVGEKAGALADGVVIPSSTRAQGRALVATVPASELPGDPSTWGVQVIMQSNEGFPSANELLTRPVNEFEGPHRFGGGNDHSCDPHVIDLLAGSATGDDSEASAQHAALGTFTCDASGGGTLATIPMIYR